MVNKKQTHILAFVGMPGAGVSSATSHLTAKGYPRVYVGGIVYDEMRSLGIEITADSQRDFREQMRLDHGRDYFITKAAEQIHRLLAAGQKKLLLDGLYSWSEYRYLKKEFPGQLTVVAIVAAAKIRHQRLVNRPERPLAANQAMLRDWAEIENLEKGGPIAMSDYYITNDSNLEDLHQQLDGLTDAARFCKAPEQC